MKQKIRFIGSFLIVVLLLLTGSFAYAQTVTSDKSDYAPLSNAVFTGSGFAPNETVVLKVKNLNKPCNTVASDSSYFPWSVVADANGDFVTNWTVCNCVGDSLRLKATGQTSGYIAYAYFTDGSLKSISVGPQLNSITYGSSGTVSYVVTFTATGNGNTTVNPSVDSLPSGVTASWKNGNPFTFSGSSGVDTLILTVASGTKIPVLSPITFTVKDAPRSGNGSLATTARVLTVSATGVNKVYDGNTTATVTLSDNRLSGDVFTDAYTSAAYTDNKNVGTGKPVSVSGISISGVDAGNYTFNTTASTTANITARGINVTAQADSRVYNGTTSSSVSPIVDALQTGDAIGTAPVQTYNTRNVGTNKTLTASGLVVNDGNGGNNYAVSYVVNNTGVITVKSINVTAQTDNRAYNGTTSSSVAPIVDALQTGDGIGTAPTQVYNTKHVGTGKTLTASGLVINDGNSGNNYAISYVTNNTGIITTRDINVTAQHDDRIYNGTTSSSVAPQVDALQTGDLIGTAPTQSYDTRNVGTSKTLTASGLV
ncbi:YDG domain-containing protein, partial [Niastella vici]|uniref:YDG domain-containing protein n=1 Tax=Niastella vici TaxID=1703345 RepID=UPI001C2012A6